MSASAIIKPILNRLYFIPITNPSNSMMKSTFSAPCHQSNSPFDCTHIHHILPSTSTSEKISGCRPKANSNSSFPQLLKRKNFLFNPASYKWKSIASGVFTSKCGKEPTMISYLDLEITELRGSSNGADWTISQSSTELGLRHISSNLNPMLLLSLTFLIIMESLFWFIYWKDKMRLFAEWPANRSGIK
jgi:hypothetical protein